MYLNSSLPKPIQIKMEESLMTCSTNFNSDAIQMDTSYENQIYIPSYDEVNNYASSSSIVYQSDFNGFGHSAESFDLSLLGDSNTGNHYEESGTVPSPSSWIQSKSALDTIYWQGTSFYPPTPPPSSSEYQQTHSPEVKPFKSPEHHSTSELSQQYHNSEILDETNRNHLLRQCLEDTSFQRKCNFQPIDFPNENEVNFHQSGETNLPLTNGGDFSQEFELNQIEPVFSLAFQEVRSDIRATCESLDISRDPMCWSKLDVKCWLTHTLSSLPKVTMRSDAGAIDIANKDEKSILNQFCEIDGKTLFNLSEQDFLGLEPQIGDKLFANLELWKLSSQMDELTQDTEHNSLAFLQIPSPSSSEHSSSSSTQFSDENCAGNYHIYSDTSSDIGSCGDARSPPSSIHSSAELMNTDDDDDEEDVERTGNNAVSIKKIPGTKGNGAHIHLWQFLKELLTSPQQHGSCIRWLDQSRGVFKIEDSVRVARLWGTRKNRPAMNYDKLSRSIRQYYRKGIMRKTERSQRLVYQFCHPYGL